MCRFFVPLYVFLCDRREDNIPRVALCSLARDHAHADRADQHTHSGGVQHMSGTSSCKPIMR